MALLLPVGAVIIAAPVALLPHIQLTGFLSFGLALLYRVTDGWRVEAHEIADSP